jgi:hypothetical protein
MSMDDDEDVIEDDSEDDDSSIGVSDEDVIEDDSEDDESSRGVYLVFDNKLAHFILRHDWQNIELHLRTEEGT